MKNLNRQLFSTTAMILILASTALLATLPTASAHDPPWNINTYAFISVAPATVGVNQQAIIYMWLHMAPPTANGEFGDRWHGFQVDVTKPDGSKQTLGPFSSDPIGFAWTLFTPTATGVYQFQFNFPGQTLAGDNLAFWSEDGKQFIGDHFEPSTSKTVSLTVQQNAVPAYPDMPQPTGYWSRPIDAQFRTWSSFSGNWLNNGEYTEGSAVDFAPNTDGPESAHILWTKEITSGGLVGGSMSSTSFYCGAAYEGKWFPPVIINGILYYNEHWTPTEWDPDFPIWRALPGVYAVDVRTGEEKWYNPDIRISFGEILRYDSPNQHGAMAYLVYANGSSWQFYDAFSGDWWYTLENVPSGTQVVGSDGSILIYEFNAEGKWLAEWNSTRAMVGNDWTWRPYLKTVDATERGYAWNITLPAGVEGGINFAFADEIILGSNGLGGVGGEWVFLPTADYTVWALSLKTGEEGKLLWTKGYSGPGGLNLQMEAASVEDKVFTIWSAQTRQHWGYSLDNGNQMWGPTESQADWDMLVDTTSTIAFGRLFSAGYGGILYSYDVKTGNLQWMYEAKDPYFMEAKWGGRYMLGIAFAADNKIFLYSCEHSPDNPKERGALFRAINIADGSEAWTIPNYMSSWAENPAIADGIIVTLNSYDNRIYAFGKGQTTVTISAPQTAVPKGTAVMITGTVTDQSTGAKGTPAIADEHVSDWMKYLYMQYPLPGDAVGVEVTLSALDSKGNSVNIGTVTSDMSGMFKKMWTPTEEGEYTVVATFGGSRAYWPSYAETALGVDAAAQVTHSEMQYSPNLEVYIIAGVVVIIIAIAAVGYMLRKQK